MGDTLQPENITGWKILEEGALHWEQWGDQYALYDALSGETHILPGFSARLLHALTITPRSADELAKVLSDESGETFDRPFVEHVSQLLGQLQVAGLVEKVAL